MLVPAGKGADDIENMGTDPRLPQMVEPEQKAQAAATPATHSGKADKFSKGKATDSKIAAGEAKKGGAKLAAVDTARTLNKAAKAPASDKTKTAAAKPSASTPTKVAKSGNGRRS